MTVIETAAAKARKARTRGRNRKPVYWWNNEVAAIRAENMSTRRKYLRICRNRQSSDAEKEMTGQRYKNSRKNLKAAILRAKREAFKELCREVNNDPWGQGYKIATKKIGKQTTCNLTKNEKIKMAEELFPRDLELQWETEGDNGDVDPFTEAEIALAASKMRRRRAPRPDGIPAELVKVTVENFPRELLEMMNELLRMGIFPERWKIAKLVLIEKPGRDGELNRRYRPLCLLDTSGKLLEHMIAHRIKKELTGPAQLSQNQYGFREGRSTVHAMMRIEEVLHKLRNNTEVTAFLSHWT